MYSFMLSSEVSYYLIYHEWKINNKYEMWKYVCKNEFKKDVAWMGKRMEERIIMIQKNLYEVKETI
jgi:hypothetical protein